MKYIIPAGTRLTLFLIFKFIYNGAITTNGTKINNRKSKMKKLMETTERKSKRKT